MTYPCCSKSDGHATWCTSMPRMLAGETVTYTSVTRHVWRVHELGAPHNPDAPIHYCWYCSCGSHGQWKSHRSQAEQGAKTHARRAR